MVMTDPIADMLTRIRNASNVKHDIVEIPASNEKGHSKDSFRRGLCKDVEYIDDNKQGIIKITLKYDQNKERVIRGLKRISKPGLRVYAKDEIPKVLGGLGIAIISTSRE